jgi:hypothetical protein
MRAVIDKEALQECFSGATSDIFIAACSSVLGVTPAILNEYLSIADRTGIFKLWFDKTFSVQANHCLVLPASLVNYGLNIGCIDSNYIGAAYHSSAPIIAKTTARFNNLAPAAWGVSILDASKYVHLPGANQAGAKVAEIISLVPGGNVAPSILKKYFLKEKKIFVFDKSINLSGADLICELTRFCDPNCKIFVMSNFNNSQGRGLLDKDSLQKLLNKNKHNGTIEVGQADRETISNFHDRFIFLGDRFQISLSSGLDCFGRNGSWNNSDGDITVHCTYNSAVYSEFKSGRKIFRLKSKGG